MSSYRYVVVVVLCATMLGGWVALARTNAGLTDEYESHLQRARAAAEIGVTTEVQAQYALALSMRPSLEVHLELADYLRDYGTTDLYEDELERVIAQYPEEAEGYERLAPVLVEQEQFSAALDVVDAARAAEVASEELDAIHDAVRYRYRVGGLSYEEVQPFSADDVGAVKVGDKWRLTRSNGQSIEGVFEQVGTFWDGNASVVLDGLAQYVDDRGRTSHVATRLDYASYGILAEGIVPALGKDGRYTYLTVAFRPAFDGASYAHATSFVGGVAAVDDGSSWAVIAPDGQVVADGYGDVARDGEIIAGQDRYFARVGDSYQLFDLEGDRVGEAEFDEARPFGPQGAAAVRIGTSWGFVDADGTMVVDPSFDDARSFAHDLAAVRVGDRWGYADPAGSVVIAPTFLEATDFASTGGALVAVEPEAPAQGFAPSAQEEATSAETSEEPVDDSRQDGSADVQESEESEIVVPGEGENEETRQVWRLLQLVRYER